MNKLEVISQARKNRTEIRGILAFPRIRDFYNALYDRLFMALEQFYLKDRFTFFLNALPRDHKEGELLEVSRFDPKFFKLTYAGIRQQRAFLEGNIMERHQELDDFWNFLETSLTGPEETKISSKLYGEFIIGGDDGLSLEDLPEKAFGSIKSYFAPIFFPEEAEAELTPLQKCEYEILKAHDFLSFYYLSLPLIQFAEFDGVVHLIISEKDLARLWDVDKDALNLEIVGNIIKAFSREYEGLILDWDIVDGNKYRKATLGDAMTERMYSENLRNNPLLKQLNYQEYYKRHVNYFQTRFELASEIPLTFRKQYHQIAILSILIDSYAHNISAHSLTALEWWFKQRAELLEKKERSEEILDGDFADIPLITSGQPLDNEIHPLLRFLLDKGAFWTGLTRAHNFGGKISSLYSVLWYDFVNNPLYLGTIAFSEDILKLNINITFLKRESDEEGVRFKKKVELDGNFVSIDLSRLAGPPLPEEDMSKSKFIIPGKKYKAIRKRLKECKAFFPGGVVGYHAFFTILENEIRNVKHFPPKELKRMKREGLTLNLSIESLSEDESDNKDTDKATYYKIGVWIKNPVDLDKELYLKRLKNLWGDIITEETNRPMLGGIYQDKVCAAMLFNNAFSSVQDKDNKRGKRYYPWVKVGSSPDLNYEEGDVIEEIELSARRYFSMPDFQSSKDLFERIYQPHQGYYKKFFHLWKGDNIFHPQNKESLLGDDQENLSRFRFVYLPENTQPAFNKCREAGIIRIIHQDTAKLETAYQLWLKNWMADKIPEGRAFFKFNVKPVDKDQFQLSALLEWGNKEIRFYSNRKHKKLMTEKRNNQPMERLNLIHGSEKVIPKGEGICRFRTHGIFQQYFCGGKKLREANLSPDTAAELFEVLATRICIFDNRLANRMEQANKEVIKNQLHCEIYSEEVKQWKAMQKQGFNRFHFLVVHLSFIEAFRSDDGKKKYSEDDIGAFIQEQVLQGKKVGFNFILVITTGRGRTQWWAKLKEQDEKCEKENIVYPSGLPYGAFVTFSPVESLIAAVENSIGMKDDIELKYRLVKILFGS